MSPTPDAAWVSWQTRNRRLAARILAGVGAVLLWLGLMWAWITWMPPGDRDAVGVHPTEAEQARVGGAVTALSRTIGERHLGRPEALQRAREEVSGRLADATGTTVHHHRIDGVGGTVFNLEVVLEGSQPEAAQVVVGAHYDSARHTPGADDNASGVAALLEVARHLAAVPHERTVRIVAFANEEPPWFAGPDMGSARYVEHLVDAGVAVHAMLSLEMLGYYDEAHGSQRYPLPISWPYPPRGDFVGVVGRFWDRADVARVVRALRTHLVPPVHGIAAPASIPGIDFSDHRSFWEQDLPGVMVTDTAFLRNPHYHRRSDTVSTLDLQRLAQVSVGLARAVEDLAGP